MFLFAKMMIKHHIKRSFMIILGIACSVAMMFGMIQMGDSLINQYKEQAMGTNLYDFQIGGLTKEQAEWLKAELDQEEIEAAGILWDDFREAQMKLESLRKMEFNLCAGTKEGLEEPGLRLLEGRWSGTAEEVVLEQYVCELLRTQIGDEIAVVCELTGEIRHLRLVGIMENSPVLLNSAWQTGFMNVSFDFLYETGLLSPETEEHALIVTVNSDLDEYDLEKIIEIQDTVRELLAQLYGLENYRDTVNRIVHGQASERESELIREIGGKFGYNHIKEENVEEYLLNAPVGSALKAFAFLLAAAMVLLVFNSMHLAITENTRELGMLRCIGMDYRQTALIIFLENILYCIFGYGIGIVFGNIINQIFAKNILLYLIGEPVSIRQLAGSYLLTAAVVLVSLILAFVLAVHKILALTPIEASKYNGATANPGKVQTMEKWSFVKFAGRNIRRERSKSMIMMLSMIFSMVILMLIVNTMSSVELPKKDQKSRFSDYEVYIPLYGMADAMEGAGTAQISFSEMEKIRDVTGVEEIYAIGGSLDLESGMRQQNGNVISDMIYNDALFRWLLEQNGKSGLWNEGVDAVCVVMGTYGEEEQELLDEIGETGAVSYKMKGGGEGILHIGAVLYTDYMPEDKGTGSNTVIIVLTEQAALEIYGSYSYTDIMVKCSPDAGDGTFSAINAVFADHEYAICGSYEIGMEKIITDTLAILYIAAMIVIATTVTAVLNMMIIMKANLILRRREHGIWRALGMPLKQLRKSISVEILLVLLISYGIAVAVSIPLQRYMLSAMEKNVNVRGMAAGYFGVGIVFIVSVYFLVMSGLRFKQTNEIISDIREE